MPSLDLRRSVLIGVSHMIPFVVVGGLLQALGLMLGGSAPLVFTLGSLALYLLAPVLAGYISFAIAGRPGLMPGLTAGLAATVTGAGFLGGLIGGVLAGILAQQLGRVPLPEWLRGLAAFLLVPLVATLISGGAMLGAIGPPLAWFMRVFGGWLDGLNGVSAVLLAAALGAMTVADLGGPLNKAAYLFAITGVSGAGLPGAGIHGTGLISGRPLALMAAVMVAGMSAPLACWLATVVRPSAYTPAERRDGRSAGVLGALFISEGAIPFAAVRPMVVIPSLMLGGVVAAIGSMLAGATLTAPHGGVFALLSAGHLIGLLGSLALGATLAAGGLLLSRAGGRDRDRNVTDRAASLGGR
ncbi:PTS fructose transporter subunit IIC [Actinoplanes palleronii]|uniref:PTS EIIC type-2 domain-containing protein n=1 Tax=Actinoplanes palleronii TaxID=113570 RepID=A0ABQ4BJH7_9ACTN|nr:PTS fructose transporter subunit IIC [Actinoplanes palleronii]GIE70838.1 hypothetical protein Apa02nite_069460 [Actinoplanes palleronii]